MKRHKAIIEMIKIYYNYRIKLSQKQLAYLLEQNYPYPYFILRIMIYIVYKKMDKETETQK